MLFLFALIKQEVETAGNLICRIYLLEFPSRVVLVLLFSVCIRRSKRLGLGKYSKVTSFPNTVNCLYKES